MDYSEEFHAPGYLANEKLLPKTVIDQHKLSLEEWENKVSVFHKQVHSRPENFKNSMPKKLVKSTKSISIKKFFDQISKMAKNQFFNWEKVKNCQKCNFTEKKISCH